MKLIVILGPTAVGKTKLATQLAYENNGEVISADSRQVYKRMDIGTGKDLEDYHLHGSDIPYHLIDIREAGAEYNLFDYQMDFYKAYEEILKRNKLPILCGGTGLYLEAALSDYKMIEVPINRKLRDSLEGLSQKELNDYLVELNPKQHNTTDLLQKDRTIRAIEIIEYQKINLSEKIKSPIGEAMIFGVKMERELLRKKIEVRLNDRLSNGMIEEVKNLLEGGISHKKLQYYGLEYKFISHYLEQKLSYNEMHRQLLQAIRRFAKKQMTWFRRMERRGKEINWIEASMPLEEKVAFIQEKLNYF